VKTNTNTAVLQLPCAFHKNVWKKNCRCSTATQNFRMQH